MVISGCHTLKPRRSRGQSVFFVVFGRAHQEFCVSNESSSRTGASWRNKTHTLAPEKRRGFKVWHPDSQLDNQ